MKPHSEGYTRKMRKIFKMLMISLFLVIYFYLMGFRYYSAITIQAVLLGVILTINSIKDSVSATCQLLKLLLPFTFTLFLFGLVFQLLQLQGRTDWLYDSLIKVIFFPASFICTKLAISLFTYKDILGLPLKNSTKHEIIFMQSFFVKAYNVMPRMDFYASVHPVVQNTSRLYSKFLTFCTFPLALYLFLMEEGQILRDFYENRKFFMEDK